MSLLLTTSDKTVNPRYMTMDHQHKSLHYMHMYASLDRVPCGPCTSNARMGDVMTLSTSDFLQPAEESKQLCANYATLLGRVVVEKVPYSAHCKTRSVLLMFYY